MVTDAVAQPADDQRMSTPAPDREPPGRSRRRMKKVLIGAAAVLAVLVVATVLWFVLGRDQAVQLDDTDALTEFRAKSGASSDTAGLPTDGRPAAGVYAASASGNESIGVPGFDEELGPNAPVTVSYSDGGCYVYRSDFNSHHWRSWTFCPTPTASFGLTELESFTARKAPGLDVATLSTYRCDAPMDFLWKDTSVGDTRTGACTGTSDTDDSVTADAGSIEVLDVGTMKIDGKSVDMVHVRTTDTLSEAQTGSEVDEWWLDATTGLPLRIVIDAKLKGGPSDYSETADLKLSTLTPQT